MTYAELKKRVLHLGLLEGFDDACLEASFSDAATRALREVALLLPRESRATIAHYPLRPIQDTVSFTHRTADISVSGNGVAAFCFYISGGRGEVVVSTKTSTQTVSISGAVRTLVRYTVSELFGKDTADVTLTFRGGYYRITEVSFFDAVEDDMSPPSNGTSYDMKVLVRDFNRFVSRPIIDGEPLTEDYFISGSVLTFTDNVPDGDYTVLYEHLPEEVNMADPDTAIDIDPAAELLVPLLCAYYVWMDDQPEKASQFYQRYAEQAAVLRNDTRRVRSNIKYRSTNGWD